MSDNDSFRIDPPQAHRRPTPARIVMDVEWGEGSTPLVEPEAAFHDRHGIVWTLTPTAQHVTIQDDDIVWA